MRVSIAMATYNGARFVREQLDSFVAQTCRPDELIVCDDGSTDDTLSILRSFQESAPFDVGIHQNPARLGYAKNFEKALSLCTGDIIFLSDQDDLWFKVRIERLLAAFVRDPSAWVIVNNAALTREDLTPSGLTLAGQLESAGLNPTQLFNGSATAFRSDLLPLILPIAHQSNGHDGWINSLGSALHCRKYVPQILQFYRRHDATTSDWPTSRTTPARRWHLFREQLRWRNNCRDPRSASDRRLEQLKVLLGRIRAHEAYLKVRLPESVDLPAVLKRIEAERHANELRRLIQEQRLFSRFALGLRFYLAGGYRRFEGWKSLARDVIR